MEHAVLLMASICLFVIGFSYFLNSKEWRIWLGSVEKRGKQASLAFGSINLLLGSFIVAFHPVYAGLPLLLTIMGYLALLKGVCYLIVPSYLPRKLRYIQASDKPLLKLSGITLMVIALLLISSYCSQNNIHIGNGWYGYFWNELTYAE